AKKTVASLQKQWRKIKYWETVLEESLKDEFEAALDKFYAKNKEQQEVNKKAKEDLIEKAKELSKSENFQAATNQLNALFEDWKKIGSVGKEVDDKLWAEFNEARQTFYTRKKEYWDEINAKFASAAEVKEKLVEEAKKLSESEEWKKTTEKFKDLFEQWKAAGSAGRNKEDALWKQFNDARQTFYDRRKAHYDELHAQQEENAAAKASLIERAKEIVASEEFTRSNTDKVKNLQKEWKNIRSAAKTKEDELWAEFHAVTDEYFEKLTKFNDNKHNAWVQRMQQAKQKKQELINRQKRMIERLEDDMTGLVSSNTIQDLNDQIADKQEFIAQLEEEIRDIDKKLEA
ncbi:MAG: DUF349 domain-containing protein, partial [Holdemanella sp.]|nr:DUF349 domain-containing protein [Holdemanella sp.]